MSDSSPPTRPTVYVVDGDEAVRDSLRTLLQLYEFGVRTYALAEEFLAADLVRPCCVITEVHLSGMSGLDLLEHLRAKSDDIPVIVIAARGDVPTAVRALRAGAVDFLEKPFVDHVLLHHLRETLQSREAPQRDTT
jgi:FixJ family two-component response regulator